MPACRISLLLWHHSGKNRGDKSGCRWSSVCNLIAPYWNTLFVVCVAVLSLFSSANAHTESHADCAFIFMHVLLSCPPSLCVCILCLCYICIYFCCAVLKFKEGALKIPCVMMVVAALLTVSWSTDRKKVIIKIYNSDKAINFNFKVKQQYLKNL